MITEATRPAHQMENKELSDIVSRIEEALENKNLKPEDRTKILIQLPNFSAMYMTSKGGKITIPGTRISLFVPSEALDETDEPVLVYIYLQPKSKNRPELDEGRRWLTPSVKCGPRGLKFKKDVYLTMPHYAVNPTQWDFDGHQTKGQDHDKESSSTLRDATIVTKYEVTMLLDHFCSHTCSGRPSSDASQEVRKWMKAGVSFHGQDEQQMQMRVQLYDIDIVTVRSYHKINVEEA